MLPLHRELNIPDRKATNRNTESPSSGAYEGGEGRALLEGKRGFRFCTTFSSSRGLWGGGEAGKGEGWVGGERSRYKDCGREKRSKVQEKSREQKHDTMQKHGERNAERRQRSPHNSKAKFLYPCSDSKEIINETCTVTFLHEPRFLVAGTVRVERMHHAFVSHKGEKHVSETTLETRGGMGLGCSWYTLKNSAGG